MDESLALGVIAEQLGVPVDSLSAETAFADLNADSLEQLQRVCIQICKCRLSGAVPDYCCIGRKI